MTANPLPTSHFSYCLHRSSHAAFGYYLGQWGYKIDWEMKSEKRACLGNQWFRSCLSAPSSSFRLCSTIPGLGICRSRFWFGWVCTMSGAQRSLLAWSVKGLAPCSSWILPSPCFRTVSRSWLLPALDSVSSTSSHASTNGSTCTWSICSCGFCRARLTGSAWRHQPELTRVPLQGSEFQLWGAPFPFS